MIGVEGREKTTLFGFEDQGLLWKLSIENSSLSYSLIHRAFIYNCMSTIEW